MAILTIYTNKFDSNENVFGNGMSGKVFVENIDGIKEDGEAFKTIDEALSHCTTNNIVPKRIDFNYADGDGVQRFWKFKIEAE